MTKPLKTVLILCAVFGLCQIATANTYNVTLDTAPLVGHPAGPFVVFLEFTDGSGIGDANNTVTLSGLDFSGGSASIVFPRHCATASSLYPWNTSSKLVCTAGVK